MKRAALALALALALTGVPADAAAYCAGGTRDTRSSTYVVGDSVTVYGARGLPGGWEVNARARRTVDCLPGLLRARLRHGTPTVVVIALGTNPTKGWSMADYRAAVDLFPRTTQVVLVTPYRNPHAHPYAAAYLRRYATWERRLARQSNVWLADWATYANQHRAVLPDGTHPGRAGQRAWAQIVRTAVARATR